MLTHSYKTLVLCILITMIPGLGLWATEKNSANSGNVNKIEQDEQAPPSVAEGGGESGGATSKQQMPRIVMAKIGDTDITVEEFMQFLGKNPSRVREALTPEGKAGLLRTAIENRLLLAAMRQEGYLDENTRPENLQGAFIKLSEKYFPLPPTPDEASVQAYYEANIEDFGIPAAVRLSQIQINVGDNPTDENKAKAKARAEAAFRRVQDGKDFGEVAAEVTEREETKERKGDVGFVNRYGHEWLEPALAGLNVGQMTQVLESPAGYDILKITDSHDAILTPYPQAREAVIKRMREEGQARARANYVKKLAASVDIRIELEELKPEFANGIFPD